MAHAALDQVEEPECTSGEAGSRREEPKLLSAQLGKKKMHAGDIAAGPIETRHKPYLNGIIAAGENNGDGGGCGFCGASGIELPTRRGGKQRAGQARVTLTTAFPPN
jgi:hypothetical protein